MDTHHNTAANNRVRAGQRQNAVVEFELGHALSVGHNVAEIAGMAADQTACKSTAGKDVGVVGRCMESGRDAPGLVFGGTVCLALGVEVATSADATCQ